MHDTPVTFDEFKQIVNRQEGPVLGTRKASDIDMGTFVTGLTNNETLAHIPHSVHHKAHDTALSAAECARGIRPVVFGDLGTACS